MYQMKQIIQILEMDTEYVYTMIVMINKNKRKTK